MRPEPYTEVHMHITSIFIENLNRILTQRKLSLGWVEQKTGVSEVFLQTLTYIASGLSFQLVLKIAIALEVSIDSLIGEDGKIEPVCYAADTAASLYSRFWRNIQVICSNEGVDAYELSEVSGKTIAGLAACCNHGKDIDIQRADAIALHLGGLTLDSLIHMRLGWRHHYDDDRRQIVNL